MDIQEIPHKYPGEYLFAEEANALIERVKEIKDGEDGIDGAKWHSGNGVPALALGDDEDFYIDQVTGDIYEKNITWQLSFNIKGDQGIQGIQGNPGVDGTDGESFAVDAVDLLSNIGLYDGEDAGFNFLASDTSDLYIKLSLTPGDWSLPINFGKGDQGDPGYVYIAYANDDIGTGFTNVFDETKNYIAILSTQTELTPPVVGNFAGLWQNYTGENVPRPFHVIDGTNVLDFSIGKRGYVKSVTGTTSFSFQNGFTGMFKLFRIIHDSTDIINFPVGTKFANGNPPNLTYSIGAIDELIVNYDGADYIIHELALDIKT